MFSVRWAKVGGMCKNMDYFDMQLLLLLISIQLSSFCAELLIKNKTTKIIEKRKYFSGPLTTEFLLAIINFLQKSQSKKL